MAIREAEGSAPASSNSYKRLRNACERSGFCPGQLYYIRCRRMIKAFVSW